MTAAHVVRLASRATVLAVVLMVAPTLAAQFAPQFEAAWMSLSSTVTSAFNPTISNSVNLQRTQMTDLTAQIAESGGGDYSGLVKQAHANPLDLSAALTR